MNKQQDKSKDYTSISSQSRPSSTLIYLQPVEASLYPNTQGASIFDKYKLPGFSNSFAFRPLPPQPELKAVNLNKKDLVFRKYRGNYRKYTVAQKEQAVKQILEGVDAREISEKYGIPRRNLLRWKKNGCERKEGGGRPTDGEMQFLLYSKIDTRQLLTQKQIRFQAKKLSKLADFKASKGWYCKFSRRYNQWKKQENEKAMRLKGKDPETEKQEVFLLPQASEGSEDESESLISDSLKKQEN